MSLVFGPLVSSTGLPNAAVELGGDISLEILELQLLHRKNRP
jgi:hypothetical protein